ncbi:hypothetical protein [Streptomyces celluloflavus]|uniref:hypothetical protein n=1 Tax=Streptomyces celluloflavus TaxID=58344 RepID=UPI00367D6CC4
MPTCPRCTGPLPNTLTRSRTTTARNLPICPPCASHEAARDVAGHAPIPPNEWPIPHH